MKVLHVSDLHIGKRVNGMSMLDDQRYILRQILDIAEKHQVSVLLIAGDVYDKASPSAEAVTVFDAFLTDAVAAGLRVLAIPGNHDSAERLAYAQGLLEKQGVCLSPVYAGEVERVELEDEHGPVEFWLLPFLKPGDVRRFFPDKEIGDDYYESITLQGMIIGMQRNIPREHLFAQIEAFVPKIRNWGICDTFCAGLKKVRKYPEETWGFLQKYLQSDKEFEIRFGVVMLLDHYMSEKYLEKLFAISESIHHEGYYVKMAVAWLLSICFVKFYDETLAFMETAKLDDFTYNKALQKARESLRISKEEKKQLQAMKRR